MLTGAHLCSRHRREHLQLNSDSSIMVPVSEIVPGKGDDQISGFAATPESTDSASETPRMESPGNHASPEEPKMSKMQRVSRAILMKAPHVILSEALCVGGAGKALCEEQYIAAAALLAAFAAIQVGASSTQTAHSVAHMAEGIHQSSFGKGVMADGLGKVGDGIKKGGKHVGTGIRTAGKHMKKMKPVQVYASVFPKPDVKTASTASLSL
jgi:hypothetical protein